MSSRHSAGDALKAPFTESERSCLARFVAHIDLSIVTEAAVDEADRDTIINETYPLYLECGRQISPQFWTVAKFDDPPTDAAKAFKQLVLGEGARVFPPDEPQTNPRPEDDR
jgi:hypothetical protein